jgi:hypothetical protein
VTQLLDSTVALVALAALAWVAVAAIVLAACKAAARADAQMAAEDDAVAMAGPMGWLASQSSPGEHVAYGAQEDLHVPPQRPVGDVQVIHRTHLA